jgi:hypothetical protein
MLKDDEKEGEGEGEGEKEGEESTDTGDKKIDDSILNKLPLKDTEDGKPIFLLQ